MLNVRRIKIQIWVRGRQRHLVTLHLKASFTEWHSQSQENNTYMHTHTHTHQHKIWFSISAGAVMGPLFSLPSFPRLSSLSFVPRLHTIMSRSCLWGAQPGRRLVFRALLFSSSSTLLLSPSWVLRLYWCWLITGAFSPLPTACCCWAHPFFLPPPPTSGRTFLSSSPR